MFSENEFIIGNTLLYTLIKLNAYNVQYKKHPSLASCQWQPLSLQDLNESFLTLRNLDSPEVRTTKYIKLFLKNYPWFPK